MPKRFGIYTIFAVIFLFHGFTLSESDKDDKKIRLNGNIILGGLFPMHEKGRGGEMCGAVKEEKGIQRVEAMLYAVDKINKDPDLLPDITLGVHILDTCSRDTYALEQSMDFIKAHMSTLDVTDYRCSNGTPPRYTPSKPVAGVIGAAASPVSIMVANILRLFKIPQISYASTAIELSDKTRFEYFSRVVPPDTYQAQAMVDIVKSMGWTYVSTLGDEGNYGEKGIAAFEHAAEKSGVCIARSLKIPRDITSRTFDRVLEELDSKAKVVVMFVNEDNSRSLLAAALRNNVTNNFYWLASDSWGIKVHPIENQELAAEGAVTILPKRKVIRDFDTYFTSLNPINNKRNLWFPEFWEKHFQCTWYKNVSMTTGKPMCTGKEKITANTYKQEGLVPFVVDSVYAMAHAIQRLHRARCPGRMRMCRRMRVVAGPELLYYIRNVSFIGAANNVVRFNEVGDGMGRYNVYQFQRKGTGSFDYVKIGEWTDKLTINRSLFKWKHGDVSLPRSVCSEPCQPGYIKNAQKDKCCWVCIRCEDYEIIQGVDDNQYCVDCPNGSYPNTNKTRCEPLPVHYMTLGTLWAIVPIVCASFGIVSVLLVFVVFIKYNSTPVIMASGRELCYVLQFGLFMCYAMTYIMVAKPNIVSCTLLRMGLGMSLSTCYSALFTKTNRISRIFNRGIKAVVKRPSYTSPKSQLIICLCLVSVQMIGAVTWLGMDLPSTTVVYPDRKTAVLRCQSTNVAIVISLLYNMILIILCTVYAFKTRKIPENFNEAKYIAFTMYATCIVWLAFIPIYFGSKSDFKIQITALCMCVNISATVALGCLFAPKVYIVLFQPHKNTRQCGNSSNMHNSQRGRLFFGRQSTRFSALGGTANGDLTSPTALALLIAQGTVGPKECQESKETKESGTSSGGEVYVSETEPTNTPLPLPQSDSDVPDMPDRTQREFFDINDPEFDGLTETPL